MKAAVIGAGGWGTALAVMLAEKGYQVALWVRNEAVYRSIVLKRNNEIYLPGVKIPSAVRPTPRFVEALQGAGLVIMAVPSHGVRAVAAVMGEHLYREAIVVNAAKGLEEEECLRLSQVLAAELPARYHKKLAVLSGPNHAEEVSRRMPTLSVVAAEYGETADQVQKILNAPYFRVYTNPDLIGVELGGALKNVIALGVGIAEGLGLGDNTRAALVTRGLVEMTRLGTALGARARTFTGLSGLGDLFVTCASRHSRNRNVGVKLGQGQTLDEILAGTPMVAEGVNTTRSAFRLARQCKIEMPITVEIYRVLFQNKSPREAVRDLMDRAQKAEIEDIAFEK